MDFHKWNGRSSAYIKEFVNGAVYFTLKWTPRSGHDEKSFWQDFTQRIRRVDIKLAVFL